MSTVGRAIRSVGIGVWHFLVGDTPEFLPAVAAVVALAFVLRRVHLAAVLAVPSAVVVALIVSLAVWRRRVGS